MTFAVAMMVMMVMMVKRRLTTVFPRTRSIAVSGTFWMNPERKAAKKMIVPGVATQ